MPLSGKSLVSILDLTPEDITRVFQVAEELRRLLKRGKKLNAAEGRVMATVFMEPSTRTRLSFQSAMLKLGGSILDFGEVERTSIVKGETLADTIRMVDSYLIDLIVLRHPGEGASKLAAEVASVPVINAGDGSREHPTQTLLDLYTIWRELGRVSSLKVGVMGDLKYGRTPSSLCYGLSLFPGNEVYLISPPELRMRPEVLETVKGKLRWEEVRDLSQVIGELDVLYITRIQKERFPDPYEYERVKGSYMLKPSDLEKAKPELIVLHPLPRTEELPPQVDETRHAKYFDQAKNGLYIRAALIAEILELRW
ncbi:MAG: aspartate carbamoyltransferase [Thermoproteota archaeon]|nr:MAG: aspartate carbamoyltransferase [Candidatus Korarchaeota archaeon]